MEVTSDAYYPSPIQEIKKIIIWGLGHIHSPFHTGRLHARGTPAARRREGPLETLKNLIKIYIFNSFLVGASLPSLTHHSIPYTPHKINEFYIL